MKSVPLLLLVLASGAQFTTGVDLVEVYATVRDGAGRILTDLREDEFLVLDEGERQAISAFAAGEFPLSVALAIDRSFSMKGRPLEVARSAAHTFLGQLRPEDQAMLLAIGSDVETLVPLSTDREAQHRALDRLDAFGSTALHDVVVEAVARLAVGRGRRALVLLTDGDDRYSRATEADVIEAVRRADVLVYPVTYGRTLTPILRELADVSGGRAILVRDLAQLNPAFRDIATELRLQYLIGFAPQRRAESGTWRTIEVRTTRPGAAVRARSGYVARE
jgi:Ca-activated chloride channel homolog